MPGVRLQRFDPLTSSAEMDQSLWRKPVSARFMLSRRSSRVAAYRGNVALAGNYPGFLDQVAAQAAMPIALVSLGNPYLLRSFPGVSAYLATFSPVIRPRKQPRQKAILGAHWSIRPAARYNSRHCEVRRCHSTVKVSKEIE